ncbi:hypothetical protein DSAG12_02267 [Promethearchaeum syntrophicum]|uniref:Uncharacterized protein n=1 Tax=Promethearchaeum syntrophicum TaxID=2594042 RepID=A0A5B9DC45_9ARCH|nr:hypothetical protein [Candidatus Prometheoarchaeum syntrophicum]QEE16437.1 hypothetical protein DSAG12_02267 [Candidatus Prometheoarchaeum syntrophicum]
MLSTASANTVSYTPYNVQIQNYFYIILCNHHKYSYFSQYFDSCEYSKLCNTKYIDYKTAKHEIEQFKQNQPKPKYPKLSVPLNLSVCLVRNETYLQKNIISGIIMRKKRTNVFILENKREN